MEPPLTIAGVLVRIAVNVLPVVAFLVFLMVLDSYKLVRRSAVALTIGAGIVVALAAMATNRALFSALGWESFRYSRFAAPLIEEALKGSCLVWLIARKRAGFMVDAAIYGFAPGTGLAIV